MPVLFFLPGANKMMLEMDYGILIQPREVNIIARAEPIWALQAHAHTTHTRRRTDERNLLESF